MGIICSDQWKQYEVIGEIHGHNYVCRSRLDQNTDSVMQSDRNTSKTEIFHEPTTLKPHI